MKQFPSLRPGAGRPDRCVGVSYAKGMTTGAMMGFNFHQISVTSAHAQFRVAGVKPNQGSHLTNHGKLKI